MDYTEPYKQLQAKRIDQRETYREPGLENRLIKQKIQPAKKCFEFGNITPLSLNVCKQLGLDEAILLSILISKYNLYEESQLLTADNYFYLTTDTLTELTGWKWDKQNRLIKKLDSLNIITTNIRDNPPKRYFKLNFCEIFKLYSKN